MPGEQLLDVRVRPRTPVPTHPPATARGRVCIALPTFNERENLAPLIAALRSAVPEASILVVDDNSPDGTGAIADSIAAKDAAVRVLHRTAKEGLGAAYRAAFREVLRTSSADVVVQMDCDFSHDPDDLVRLLEALRDGTDLVLGSRYVRGGSTLGWSRRRRLLSMGGSLFSRAVLGLPYRDLTGGFKVWRRATLAAVLSEKVDTNGYGFQVEMTYRAHRAGAGINEVPIIFRERVAGSSKMSGGIVREAMLMVLRLRLAGREAVARSRQAPQ